MPLVAKLDYIHSQLQKILNEPPLFYYKYIQDVTIENEDDSLDTVCDWEEDREVGYPDFFDENPIVMGETILELHVADKELRIRSSNTMENPTWKDLLKELNSLIRQEKLPMLNLYSFALIGITPSGMGYVTEAYTFSIN